MHIKHIFLLLLINLGLFGCVTYSTPESEQVQVVWQGAGSLQDCKYVSTVYGSEGHFYDYWLHSDKNMVWGTINQMRINAAKKGADTIYLYQPFGFLSSVTMMANAYQCKP